MNEKALEWQTNGKRDCQRYLVATESYKISSLALDNFICWGWQHYLLQTKIHTQCWLRLRSENLFHAHTCLVKHWHIQSLHLPTAPHAQRSTHSCKFYKLGLCTITSSHIQPRSPPCSSISWLLILSEDLIRCTNYRKLNFHLEMEKIQGYIRRRVRGSQLWQKSQGTHESNFSSGFVYNNNLAIHFMRWKALHCWRLLIVQAKGWSSCSLKLYVARAELLCVSEE